MKYLLLIISITAFSIVGSESAGCFSCFKPKVDDDDNHPPSQGPVPRHGDEQAPRPGEQPPKSVEQPPKYKTKTAEEYQNYFFNVNSNENAPPEVARERMVYLRNSYKKGLILENYERERLTDKWYELTQFTRCKKENEDAFENLIQANSEYKNFVSLLEWERELYRTTCVESSVNF